MNDETPEEFVFSQKETKVSELNGEKDYSKNIMDEIQFKHETFKNVESEKCAEERGCETSPSKCSTDEISSNESNSSDVQIGDDLEVNSSTIDKQILEDESIATFENGSISLDFDFLSQKSKEEILLYAKVTFKKLIDLLKETNSRYVH